MGLLGKNKGVPVPEQGGWLVVEQNGVSEGKQSSACVSFSRSHADWSFVEA